MGKHAGKLIGLAAGAIAALAGCGRAPRVEVPTEAIIRLSDAFSSDFALVGVDGGPVSDEDFRGRVMVVYFGFATCPDVCPLALAKLSAALNELTEAEVRQLAPVFITVDPARDTPEKLKEYLAFDPRIAGLTGSAEAVDRARQSFKVYARRQPLPESALGYTMDHSSLFYVVDRAGIPQVALHDSLSGPELAVALRRNIRQRS